MEQSGQNGWIKIHRHLLDWEWIDDPMVLAFWIRLLLSVNTQDKKWFGRIIKRGQTLTSIRSLSENFNMATNTVRRILRDLEASGEIKVESDKHGTLITVVNFNKYQNKSVSTNDTPNDTPVDTPLYQQMTHQMTHGVSTNDTNIRSIEYKEGEEEKNINTPTPMRVQEKKIGFDTFGIMANVYLKPIQHRQLIETFGEDAVKTTIDELSCKLADGSTDSGNHYATLTYWLNYRKHVAPAKTSGYQKPAPATDPNQETREQREQRLKALWQQASEEDRQSYLDTYHCYPWEREQ